MKNKEYFKKVFKKTDTVAAPLQAAAKIQKLHFYLANYHIKSKKNRFLA